MRIVLLANAWVGAWVAEILRGEDVVGLVVHPKRTRRNYEELLEASGADTQNLLISSKLHDPKPFEVLQAWDPDIIISAWYGYILRPQVLSLPRAGCINLHPAYLPYNRGKFPNVWCILDGTPAGVSIHYMDEGVDTGDLIARKQVAIAPDDTGQTLYRKLEEECAELFREYWPQIRDGSAPRIPQEDLAEQPTFHLAGDVAEVDRIDLDATYAAQKLIDLLRARTFPPHPAAYFEKDGQRIWVRVSFEKAPEDEPSS